MFISILIPTRKRHHVLDKVVNNIISTADNINDIEILFKTDIDDINSIHVVSTLQIKHPTLVKQHISPRPESGHKNLHVAYNELANLSTGRYLWIYNDDARIMSTGWDTTLQKFNNEQPYVIKCRFFNGDNKLIPSTANIFPLIHRDIFLLQGFLGLHSSIDLQYEILCSFVPHLEQFESQVDIIHGEDGLESEFIKDKFPAFDPQSVRQFEDQLIQIANRLKETYKFDIPE